MDAELVRRHLVANREQAKVLVLEGSVLVAGTVARKPDRLVDPAEPIVVTGPPPRYVSRGGHKLEAALAGFELSVAGRRAIDVGASTGGFTDCLLQAGAHHVVAVDVGHGQLHERIRHDPRVEVHERTNVRYLDPRTVGGPAPLVVVDLSFISLRTVLDALLGLVAPGGRLVVLVKPQFEAGRQEASRGRGVISDPAVWRRVLGQVVHDLAAHGAAMMGVMVSPITEADGNVEFLCLVAPPPAVPLDAATAAAVTPAVAERLDAVVAEARALVQVAAP